MPVIQEKFVLECLLENTGLSDYFGIAILELFVQAHSECRKAFPYLSHSLSILSHLLPEIGHLFANVSYSMLRLFDVAV